MNYCGTILKKFRENFGKTLKKFYENYGKNLTKLKVIIEKKILSNITGEFWENVVKILTNSELTFENFVEIMEKFW